MVRYAVTLALFVSAFVSAVFLAAGCGKRSEVVTESAATVEVAASETAPIATTTPPAASPAAAAAPAAAAVPAATVMASETYSQDPNIRADLLEVKRVSGGALLVKWRIVNTTPASGAGTLSSAEAKPIHYDFSWTDLYYVDPAENKKYGYLTDSEGNRILDVWWGQLKTGETRANWAKFPAPPATSTKISLTLPKFPPFEDVPVAP
jgi:hypothetical protein